MTTAAWLARWSNVGLAGRHRQHVAGLMTVANVSMMVALQNGQAAGRPRVSRPSPDPRNAKGRILFTAVGWRLAEAAQFHRGTTGWGRRPSRSTRASSLFLSRSTMTDFPSSWCAVAAETPRSSPRQPCALCHLWKRGNEPRPLPRPVTSAHSRSISQAGQPYDEHAGRPRQQQSSNRPRSRAERGHHETVIVLALVLSSAGAAAPRRNPRVGLGMGTWTLNLPSQPTTPVRRQRAARAGCTPLAGGAMQLSSRSSAPRDGTMLTHPDDDAVRRRIDAVAATPRVTYALTRVNDTVYVLLAKQERSRDLDDADGGIERGQHEDLHDGQRSTRKGRTVATSRSTTASARRTGVDRRSGSQ